MATQEELVLQQFAGAKKRLGQQKTQAQDKLAMDLNRQNAITGASGGRSIKAAGKAQKGLEDVYASATGDLASQEAGALQSVAAQKEAQQFQTSERLGGQSFAEQQRLGSQQFQTAESRRQEGIQQKQFKDTYGLQMRQFNESKDQFKQQMGFQMREFSENQKTNLINAMTAFEKSGLGNMEKFNQLLNSVNRIRSRI